MAEEIARQEMFKARDRAAELELVNSHLTEQLKAALADRDAMQQIIVNQNVALCEIRADCERARNARDRDPWQAWKTIDIIRRRCGRVLEG